MKMEAADEHLLCTAPFSWRGAKPRFMTPNAAPQPRLEAEATQERRLEGVGCRVEPMVTHPAPPPTRTCAIHAYGSSSRASATPTAVQWGSGDTIGERKVSLVCRPTARSARRRLPSRGSLGSHFPTFLGTLRRYDCHHAPLGSLHLALASRYLACFQTFVVSLPGSWSGGSPRARQGLWSPGPPLRV